MKVPVMAVVVAGNFAMRVVKADVWTASQVTEVSGGDDVVKQFENHVRLRIAQ